MIALFLHWCLVRAVPLPSRWWWQFELGFFILKSHRLVKFPNPHRLCKYHLIHKFYDFQLVLARRHLELTKVTSYLDRVWYIVITKKSLIRDENQLITLPVLRLLQPMGQNLGRVFNSRSVSVYVVRLCCFQAKRPNLKSKTRPKQLLRFIYIGDVFNAKSLATATGDSHYSTCLGHIGRRNTDRIVSIWNFCIAQGFSFKLPCFTSDIAGDFV